MFKKLFFSTFVLLALFVSANAQTYGNWSGILHTQSVAVTENGNPDFHNFTQKIQEYLIQNYKGKYIRLITYVVKKGHRYTVSIKFPQDGIERSMEFIGYNPFISKGFFISYQNKNVKGKYMLKRVNFSNSPESDYDRVVIVVSTYKPSSPFYLRIQYPAVPDNVVDAAQINPAEPDVGKFYWGNVVKEPILMK